MLYQGEEVLPSVGQDPERRQRPRLASRTVDLDVGGTVFRTTEMTLRKSPYFQTLLEIDDGTTMFVDRCPILFAKVLQYLRTNAIYVPSAIALLLPRARKRTRS